MFDWKLTFCLCGTSAAIGTDGKYRACGTNETNFN
jgi:hypothetical protein